MSFRRTLGHVACTYIMSVILAPQTAGITHTQCLVLTPAYKKFLMLMLTYAYLRLLKETDQSAALTYSYLKKA